MEKFTFFFSNSSVFSNWYMCKIEINSKEYCCSEQYFMEQKALFFNDLESAKYIMATKSAYFMKKRGRAVTGFCKNAWEEKSKEIMYQCVYAKFLQNSDLTAKLFQTYGTILAETNPFDTLWGIGLSAENPKALNQDNWRGKNWLGNILMQVRQELIDEFFC